MSEIKVLFDVPIGCTSHKTVHPVDTAIITGSRNMHTPGAHLQKSSIRPRKCARRVQGAPLISDTVMHEPKKAFQNLGGICPGEYMS